MAKMIRFFFFFFFMLFLLATAIVASPVDEEEEIEMLPVETDFAFPPESDYVGFDDDCGDEAAIPPPQPSAEESKFLTECLSKMTPECGKEVFTHLFEDLTVTEACCGELVAMGKRCHIGLVKTTFALPVYKANASLGIPRSKQVWSKCALIGEPYASSPIPSELDF